MRFINIYLRSLEVLDLSEATMKYKYGSPCLSKLIIAEGVTELQLAKSNGGGESDEAIYCVLPTVELPSTLKKVPERMFGLYKKSAIICHAVTPPAIYTGWTYIKTQHTEPHIVTSFYDGYDQMKDMVLYVPAESVETYKSTDGWSQFGTILPIEE